MRTITNTAFITGLEDGSLEWPPFEAGTFLYARVMGPDISEVGREFVRTVTP